MLSRDLDVDVFSFTEEDPELRGRSGELNVAEIEILAELEESVVGVTELPAPIKEEHEPLIPAKYWLPASPN